MKKETRERSKDEIPFRELTTGQKCSYLWDYYRLPAVIVLVVVVFALLLIRSIVTEKEAVLTVTLVDCPEDIGVEEYVLDYAASKDIQSDEVAVSDAMLGKSESGGGAMSQAGMALYVRLQGGAEDVLIFPEEEFEEFASSGYFLDLTDVVPSEWTERLIVVEQSYDEYEDTQPEPMACAIRLSDIGRFGDSDYAKNAVIAISYNPAHPDMACDFLNDLLRNGER